MHLKYFIIFFCALTTPLQAARILSISAVPLLTQYAFKEPLLKELVKRGHQITSISNYPQKEPLENFRDVVVKENKHLFDEFKNYTLDNIEANHYEIIDAIYNKAFKMCLNILCHPTVRKVFNTEKFDLIILDIFFTESFFGLSEHFKAPIIGTSAFSTMISVDELVGNISPMSYIPNMILPLKEMNFWQRFLNVLLNSMELAHYYFKYMPVQKQIYNKYFPAAQISFEQAQRNFALVLVNDHFSLSTPRPYVPNMIEVAGLHINTNPEPLPAFLKEILDNAKEGVIFISVESLIPEEVINVFLRQLKALKQIVIWKTSQVIENSHSNIYINDNYSQSSILQHPNIKLFITESNFLCVVESAYFGVPILGLAHTDNTDDCIDYIKRVGNGLTIKLHSISDKTFAKALNELLTSTHYMEYAKLLSTRFQDQLTTPMERAVYWIEYVLRHNGAAHLRNNGQNLNWYQYYNIDILFFLFAIISLLICLAYAIIKILTKFYRRIKIKQN